MAIDTYWDETIVLLPFDGANNSLAITDIKKHTVLIQGGAKLSTAQAPTGCTSSLYVDGNNSYLAILTAASNYDLSFMLGEYCIEFPFYRLGDTSTDTATDGVLIDFRTSTVSQYLVMLCVSGSTVAAPNNKKIRFLFNGTYQITSTTEMGTSWHWITLTRVWDGVSAYKVRLFIDGVQEGSTFTDSTGSQYESSLRIGGRYETSGDFRSANGYIGPLRITKHGRGLSGAFTPPTLPYPVPQISGTVLDAALAPKARAILVCEGRSGEVVGGAVSDAGTGDYSYRPPTFEEHRVYRVDELFDPPDEDAIFNLSIPSQNIRGEVIDTCGHAFTFFSEPQSPYIVSSNPPYTGERSLYQDSGRWFLSCPSQDFYIGKQDFSLELMFYPISGGHGASDPYLCSIGADAQGALRVYCPGSASPTSIHGQFYNSGSWVDLWTPVATTVANDTWHKLQLRRVSGVFYMEINGVGWASSASTSYSVGNTSGGLYAGNGSTQLRGFKGKLGPMRLTLGARRAAQATPQTTFLKPCPPAGGGANVLIYDKVIPG
jgi:hypothetical protein